MIIEGHLDGIAKIRKFCFRSEQVDFVSLWKSELIDCFVYIEKLDRPIVVRLNFGKRTGCVIVNRLAGRSAQSDIVNLSVTQFSHLSDLLDLLWIVYIAVRLVAASVDVNTIQNLVIVIPIPVLVLHRCVHRIAGDHFLGLELPIERADESL